MDKNVSALVSALDAIAFARNQNPRELKLIARNALKGWESAQQNANQVDKENPDARLVNPHLQVGKKGVGIQSPRR